MYKIATGLIRGYRIALLADLHGEYSKQVLASLAINHPDVIVLVGDIVKTNMEDSLGLCDFLTECVCTAPTVMT